MQEQQRAQKECIIVLKFSKNKSSLKILNTSLILDVLKNSHILANNKVSVLKLKQAEGL